MRATKAVLFGVLAVSGAACFTAAASSALELRERAAATRRGHLWQWVGPGYERAVAEEITDVEPATLEPEPVARSPRVRRAPIPPKVEVPAPIEVDPADAIRMALRSRRAAFEHCYEQELKKQASFNGFIVIALSLAANGRVTDAHLQEGNRRDAVVGACIVAQLRRLQLPALTSEADLLIPIRLQAHGPS